ncbi:MAG TPA: phosphoenolpyruvate--protein phosphotransferase [Candidatus Sulfotelmatobacter sp.]|nr:phosphoenolpyruvate--protein phosphotransferase [Candidatus Sulfotelmatobacter sp.]
MIGIVLVSHSKALATAIRELVVQMVGPDFPIAVAAGVGDDFAEIGTDAVHIYEVLQPFCAGDGAVVLMDLGSAVLSAQTALELLESDGFENVAAKIRLVPAPIVEAAVAASVQANAGADLDAVAAEAMTALEPKLSQLDFERPGVGPAPASIDGPCQEIETVIENPNGLHARPAAALVQAMGSFQADVRILNLTAGRGPASVRSLTGIGLVQARKGDRVRFSLSGADAQAASDRLRQLMADHFGEADLVRGGVPQAPASVAVSQTPDRPVGASDGVAMGRLLSLSAALPEAADHDPGTADEELARLDTALARVAADLRHPSGLDAQTAGIFAAQALMLSDPALLEPVRARLQSGGESALSAWRAESLAVADAYAAMEDAYLKARAADLRDIAGRVMRALAGESQQAKIAPNPPAVLLTDELLPSEAMACQPGAVLGILARHGSPTAHAAILARTLGIPMVVGVPADVAKAAFVGLDGASGELWVDPSDEERSMIEGRRIALADERAAFDALKQQPAVTLDGQSIEVLANVGNAADAADAKENGAEGVGLLRTEFVYLPYKTMPSEDEQVRSLAAVLAPLGNGPVVVRTPDIGADKPAAFMPSGNEQNPFLGVRGVRLSLRNADFFSSNLRAILRAGQGRDLWIMLPMVTDPDELAEARHLLMQAHAALDQRGAAHAWPVRLGMMVEVPAAALMADGFARQADFFSIGTNDLTQYILAAERGNGDLARWQDAAHPAVLRVIRDICAQADARDCHVSVCGDAASDPIAAALLIGAGVRSLSVRPNQIAAIKARIRQWSQTGLADLARHAMAQEDAVSVRAFASKALIL